MDIRAIKDDPYPFANTRAARMLADGIARASDERGKSLRSLAKDLRYKQATVLSHMANGRVAVPLERAAEIAQVIGIEPGPFITAVVAQKAPSAVEWLASPARSSSGSEGMQTAYFATGLDEIVGFPVKKLNPEQELVLREVVLDPQPARRWLSAAELPIMLAVREEAPDVAVAGFSRSAINRLRQCLRTRR